MSRDSQIEGAARSERSRVSAVAGAVILLDALLVRLALTADEARVYVFGHPISWVCSLRRAGLLCPTCGMTRSAVLALHGELARAWKVAPGGLLLAGGLPVVGVLLLASVFRRTPWPRWMRLSAMACGAAAVLIWLGGWAAQFARAWRAG